MCEIGDFYGGLSGKSKADFSDGNAQYITYMNIFSNISVNLDIEDKVKISDKESQNVVKYGDILFTGSSETPDECGMSSAVTNRPNSPFYLNSFCFGFRLTDYYNEIIHPDYSKHIFRSKNIRKQIIGTSSGVTRFNVSKRIS